MIIHYGYMDGSGKYYVSIDTDKCSGCGDCIGVCPQKILEMENILIDIDEKAVARVREEFRKKIKYSCSSCTTKEEKPCVLSCRQNAIKVDI